MSVGVYTLLPDTLQLIRLLKAFYGCLYGLGCGDGVRNRKTTCGVTIQKERSTVVTVKRTVAFVHSSKAGRFALNWVIGEHIHI